MFRTMMFMHPKTSRFAAFLPAPKRHHGSAIGRIVKGIAVLGLMVGAARYFAGKKGEDAVRDAADKVRDASDKVRKAAQGATT